MEISPRKSALSRAAVTANSHTSQQLKGGCKTTMRPGNNIHMERFKKKTSPGFGSAGNSGNNENCRPSPRVPRNIPANRASNILQMSLNNKSQDGIWRQHVTSPPANTRFASDSPKYSNSLSKNKKTYSKLNTPRKSPLFGPNAENISSEKPIVSLKLNSSVTVTPITAAVASTSSTCIQSTPPSSSRRLKFGPVSTRKFDFEDNTDDGGQINLFNKRRMPLTPIAKSTILCDISPIKIDKAYGQGSSPSEKENVPFVHVPEKPTLPHLLGFPNLGNSCYVNAVLQSVLGVRVFRCDVSSCSQQLTNNHTSTLLYSLTQVLAARRTGRSHALILPLRLLKENLEKLDSSFIGQKMQDANEFLTKVLDTIKDEFDQLQQDQGKDDTDNARNDSFEETGSLSSMKKCSLSPCAWSPFKPNVPKLFNNSVVIRSIPVTQDDTGKRSAALKGIKRSLDSDKGEENVVPLNKGQKLSPLNEGGGLQERHPLSDNEHGQSSIPQTPKENKALKVSPADKSSLTDGCSSDHEQTLSSRKQSSSASLGGDTTCGDSPPALVAVHSPLLSSPGRDCTPVPPSFSSPRGVKRAFPGSSGLQRNAPQTAIVNPITANFGFQLCEVYQCLGCNESVRRAQDYFSLYVHLSPSSEEDEDECLGPSSLRQAVADYMKQEERELKCEHCGHGTASVSTRFTRMPRILIIQVKRYTFNAAQSSSLKVSASIMLSKYLDLAPFTEEETCPYPAVEGEPCRSAPLTPCKVVPPSTPGPARCSKSPASKSKPEDLNSSVQSESQAAKDSNVVDTSETEKPALSEEEQFQEALRRSLEENVAVGNGSPEVVTLDEEEENFQRALKLSLKEALQQEAAEAAAAAAEATHKASQAARDDATETCSTPERKDNKEERQEEEEEEVEGPHCYQLASIVSHFGRNTTAGHYTSDVLSESGREWRHYDDESVTELPQAEVLGESRQRNGYIFFYVHRDLLPSRC